MVMPPPKPKEIFVNPRNDDDTSGVKVDLSVPDQNNLTVPVFVPNGDELKLEIGRAYTRSGTLVVEFNDRLPALAIQNAMSRGTVMGLSVININQVVEEMSAEEIPEDDVVVAEIIEGDSGGSTS